MAQTNSNATHVLSNNGNAMMPGTNSKPVINGTDMMGNITSSPAALGSAASDTISTILNSGNDGNLDTNDGMPPSANYNDDYSTALNYTLAATEPSYLNTAALIARNVDLANNVNNVQFLPTEAVAKTEWNADDKLADITGSYLDAATWKAVPKLTGNASAFTLQNANDAGKTVTLSETISGSPFTTGNGAVSEAFTFTGTANDVLTVKHDIAVANVPATTNKNNASALDVRNESYAETYAKQGVSSNYALNTTHKYAEVNGNQTLNDALAQTYVYKDANLTISSAVKIAVADAANINGSERIVENKAANYSYAHAKTGSVNYVVTDTRDLAQADQRTWTNVTTTNVAKFEVVDNTNDGKTTITAKGLITGTTDNRSTAKSAATPTTFKATNAEFKVVSDHYTLTVDPKEFDVDHAGVASNALLTLVDITSSVETGNPMIATPTVDVFNSPLGNAPVGVSMADAFNPYVTGTIANARLDGTQFKDVITVKDTADKTFAANINAGAGNDTITGGFGGDVINGGAGADVIEDLKGGNNTIDGGTGNDTITVSAGTNTIIGYEAAELVDEKEVTHDVVNIKPGATARFEDAVIDNKFYVVSNDPKNTKDIEVKTFEDYTSKVLGATDVVFDYSDATKGAEIEALSGDVTEEILIGNAGEYTVEGFEVGVDSLTVAEGEAAVKLTLSDGTVYNVAADTVIPATVKTIADLTELAGVTPDKLNLVGADKKGSLNDTLEGAGSDDTLEGRAGADSLTGGAGADLFVYKSDALTNGIANRVDTITDFSKAQGDKIDVSALGFKENEMSYEAGMLKFDNGTTAKIELEIKVIGDAPTATDVIFA
jgi:Ca2+-binding RTX toxin-like protein